MTTLPSAPQSGWLNALIVIVTIAIQMVGWSAMLRYNLPRAEAVIEAQPERRNFLVLSADFGEYRDYFRDYPKSLSEISRQNAFNEYYKRPLFGPISAGLSLALITLFGIEYPDSMFLILSFYPSLAGVMFFWLMRRTGLSRTLAGGMTALCIFSFGWLSLFSVPESYSLAVCSVIACLLSGSTFLREPDLSPASATRHAVLAGLGSWLYLPAAASTLLILSAIRSRRQFASVLLPALILAATIAYAPHLLYHGESAALQVDYARKWMTLSNFFDPSIVWRVVVSCLFFSITAPVPDFVTASPEPHAIFVAENWIAGALMLIQTILLFWLVLRSRVHRLAGVAALMAILIGFHIYFNPHEVLLYLSPIVPVLALGAGIALAETLQKCPPMSRDTVIITASLYLFVAALAYVNLGATLGI